jgi:hypothetical protein
MSTRDQLLDDLSHSPDNWRLRGVLADWCEDADQPGPAVCLRWMIRNRKRPHPGFHKGATWFNADTVAPDLGDPESDLPGELFARLEGGKEIAHYKVFPSLRAAEEALLAAWSKALEAGWQPAG